MIESHEAWSTLSFLHIADGHMMGRVLHDVDFYQLIGVLEKFTTWH